MSAREEKSYCRMCWAFCGVKLTVEDDQIIKVVGDNDDPWSRGFVCFKGLQAPEQHNGPERLLKSLERVDGELVEIDSEAALANAGEKLKRIVDAHGPTSVGLYSGTQCYLVTLDAEMIVEFAGALGTPRNYATMTIDQSAKWIAEQRLGAWAAGPLDFRKADVWMVIGSNPLVSMTVAGGADAYVLANPVKSIREARQNGMKLIVIDPRVSETAKLADLHIQPRPGRDGELIGSMLHVILREGWQDKEFCDEYVNGLADLQRLVQPFAPESCAGSIGVSVDEIELAARMFAKDATYGMAGGGTGSDMARHSNLAEHLIEALNVVCGRFPREGEPLTNTPVLGPDAGKRAEVWLPDNREWEVSAKSSSHGLGSVKGTMMSAELADEILHEGEHRLRALICVGGNPAAALPDQRKAEDALSKLELLITIDPRMSATARLADYVFAPKVQYERSDHTGSLEMLHNKPYAYYVNPVVPGPPGSDLVDDWYVLWSLAKSLGLRLNLRGQEISMDEAPKIEELFAIQLKAARVPVDEVISKGEGALYDVEPVLIGSRKNQNRFQLTPEDVAEELQQLASELAGPLPAEELATNEFQIIVRRHREWMNSTAADFSATNERFPGNPAYFNSADLSRLGWVPGMDIKIVRGNASVSATIALDDGVRQGVVSVGHCRSGSSSNPFEATNALVDSENDLQSINRMPVMTGMKVAVIAG
jgi:anaerobic selenocysteine-containing dehydrogenase